MAIRYYLVPEVGAGTPADPRRPKYFVRKFGGFILLDGVDYGYEPLWLVKTDVTGAENTTLVANADVIGIPLNLDTAVNAQLATVQSKLSAVNIPNDWITSGMTYRTVLKWIWKLFQFMQRFQQYGQAARLLATMNLSSTVGDLSATKRQRLNDIALARGLDSSSIQLSTTIQNALKILINQVSGATPLD